MVVVRLPLASYVAIIHSLFECDRFLSIFFCLIFFVAYFRLLHFFEGIVLCAKSEIKFECALDFILNHFTNNKKNSIQINKLTLFSDFLFRSL